MKKNVEQAKKYHKWERLHDLLLLVALVLLLQPLPALAGVVSLPEIGLSLNLPNSLDVYTRDMSRDDPLLKLSGQTAEQAAAELAAQGLSLSAQDIAGAYSIQLSVSHSQGPDFAELDDSQLVEIAGAQSNGQVEILRSPQAAFIILRSESEASSLTRVKGKLITLRLTASSGLREGMVKTLRGIAQSMDFGLRQ